MAVQAQETRLAVWRVMIESRRALTLREIQQRVGHQDGVRLHLRHFAAAGLVRYENLIDRWRVMCDPVKRALVTRQLERKLQGPGGPFEMRIERARVLYLRLKQHENAAVISRATRVPTHFLYQQIGGQKPMVETQGNKRRVRALIRYAEKRLSEIRQAELDREIAEELGA